MYRRPMESNTITISGRLAGRKMSDCFSTSIHEPRLFQARKDETVSCAARSEISESFILPSPSFQETSPTVTSARVAEFYDQKSNLRRFAVPLQALLPPDPARRDSSCTKI